MHVPRPTALRALGAAALVVASGLLAAPPASAHNVVVSTVPAAGATVTELPTEVVLNFEEAPLPGGTAIIVRDPAGNLVTASKAVIDGAMASVQLETLTVAGKYGVSYRSASDDGHTITGSFAFTVPESLIPNATPIETPTPTPTESASASGAASGSPSATASPAPEASGSGGGALPWLLGGLAVLVVAGVAVVLVRRRSA